MQQKKQWSAATSVAEHKKNSTGVGCTAKNDIPSQ
jgi:hypothetical protein